MLEVETEVGMNPIDHKHWDCNFHELEIEAVLPGYMTDFAEVAEEFEKQNFEIHTKETQIAVDRREVVGNLLS